jgi:hypothetical protein
MVQKVLAWSSFGMAFVFLIWAGCVLAGVVPAGMIGGLPVFTFPLIVSILLAVAVLVMAAFGP